MSSSIRSDNNFLVFGAPLIQEEEIQEVVDSLESGWVGTGPKVHRFEEAFRSYQNASHAIAVHSCTAALHLSLVGAGICDGDEVITTAMTFPATINAIIHAGGTPVLVDVKPGTFNMNPEQVEEAVTDRTEALLPVHYAGHPCDMNALCDIADRYDLKIIEDCAHAIEATYQETPTGQFGEFGCFSFYVTKNIMTGEGGMILTDREEKAEQLKKQALHGLSSDAWDRYNDEGYDHYYVVDSGFKYNMMDIQAALGLHQLQRIESFWRRRRDIWNQYADTFDSLPVSLLDAPDNDIRHAYHLFTLQIEERRTGIQRDQFLQRMEDENIGVGVHYLSIPEHPFYQEEFGWDPSSYPVSHDYGQTTVSLPLSPGLSDQDVQDVIKAVHKILS